MKPLFGAGLIVLLSAISVFLSEGAGGFRPFINIEALVFVVAGTFLLIWSAYPARSIAAAIRRGLSGPSPAAEKETAAAREVLDYAAACSIRVGMLGTLLGLIVLLASAETFEALPRRLALVLAFPFFGVFLSKMVFAPMAQRLPADK